MPVVAIMNPPEKKRSGQARGESKMGKAKKLYGAAAAAVKNAKGKLSRRGSAAKSSSGKSKRRASRRAGGFMAIELAKAAGFGFAGYVVNAGLPAFNVKPVIDYAPVDAINKPGIARIATKAAVAGLGGWGASKLAGNVAGWSFAAGAAIPVALDAINYFMPAKSLAVSTFGTPGVPLRGELDELQGELDELQGEEDDDLY